MRAGNRWCPCCEREMTKVHFYNFAVGTQHNEYLPYCKDCVKDRLQKYIEILGDKSGFWVLLSELGLPFIQDVYVAAVNSRAKPPLIERYMGKIKESQTVYNGFWDSDVSFEATKSVQQKMDEQKAQEKTLEELQRIWGKYPDDEYNEAYGFLEDMFQRYTADVYDMDANLVDRYRDLCKAGYQKRKADETGDISEIAKAQESLAKQLKLLKLDDFQQKKQDITEKMIERLCWTIENTRPAECEDLDKYRDFSGFGKTWDHLMRCVKNLIAGTKEYPEVSKDVMS